MKTTCYDTLFIWEFVLSLSVPLIYFYVRGVWHNFILRKKSVLVVSAASGFDD